MAHWLITGPNEEYTLDDGLTGEEELPQIDVVLNEEGNEVPVYITREEFNLSVVKNHVAKLNKYAKAEMWKYEAK